MADGRYEKLTPMFRQYQAIKARYPDVLVLFRLGDFYEMFGEDAKIGSQVLQLVLTSREIGKGNRVPMCGVPHHAVERYIAKLLEAGYKVAICDQLEEPSPKKRLVHRDVTRVLTPGTLVEEAFLEAKQYNFLVAISGARDEGRGTSESRQHQHPALRTEHLHRFGLAVAEVSTGEFAVTELDAKTLWDELARLQPAEVLLPEQLATDETFIAQLKSVCETTAITSFDLDPFAEPERLLCQHFQVTTLDGFGVTGMPLAIRAAAMVIAYLKRTQLSALEHLKSLSTYSVGEFMLLDNATKRNLELVQSLRDGGVYGTLLWVLDETVTPMGGRLLRRWILQPLLRVDRINERLEAVDALYRNTLWRQEIREVLKSVPDLERLVARVGTGTANPRDLAQIRSALQVIPKLREVLTSGPELPTLLQRVAERLHTADDLRQRLEDALVDNPPQRMTEGGIFRDGYHPELDELRYIARHGKELIAALEAKERERTGIKNLRVGYNQVFGYYIEVTKANLHLVPRDYIRKQTLTDVERFVTPELKQLESKVLGAEERIGQLEYQLFVELRQEVAQRSSELLETARAIAELDVLATLAEVAAKNHYTRPIVDEGDEIIIKEGRHPVIEQVQRDKPFVPNDCRLDNRENQLLIITGPNAAGKCLSLDTYIFTDKGMLTLRELMPEGAKLGQFSPINAVSVKGFDGEATATHFYNDGIRRTVKIRTRFGFELEGTTQHRVWVRRPDGTEGWKRLGEIEVGDFIAIDTQIGLWGNEVSIPPMELPKRAKKYRLPTELTPDLAYLMGLLIGDGTLTYTHSYALTTKDKAIRRKFVRLNQKLFGYRVQRFGRIGWRVTSLTLRQFLAHLGLGYWRAEEKRVPASIRKAPKHIVIAFLQGLFDTNGYADNRRGDVQLTTASETLAKEVQLLLLNLGILSCRRRKLVKGRIYHEISLYGENAARFFETVGFRLRRKQSRRSSLFFPSPVPRPSPLSLRLPNFGIPHVAPLLKQIHQCIVQTSNKPTTLKRDKTVSSVFYTYLPRKVAPSYRTLERVLAYCQENGITGTAVMELERIVSRRIFYDAVSAVETSKAHVADLNVEPDHAYVANGFVSHNSTYLRQVALIVLMAQMGSFVPAKEAKIGIVDRIFTRVGAHDELIRGQSTFMVEMSETANILHNATERSLVLIDEIGRGTSTYDGIAIAWAVAEELHRIGCKCLFATHYHHLNELENLLPRVRNYRADVLEEGDKVVFLYRIVPGGTDRSYGIQVARLAGLPEQVIDRAKEILMTLESNEQKVITPPKTVTQLITTPVQLRLFEFAPHPVLERLKQIDPDSLTPREALSLLYELKRKLNEIG
jgi:DNA mismatch repair protein MutS